MNSTLRAELISLSVEYHQLAESCNSLILLNNKSNELDEMGRKVKPIVDQKTAENHAYLEGQALVYLLAARRIDAILATH